MFLPEVYKRSTKRGTNRSTTTKTQAETSQRSTDNGNSQQTHREWKGQFILYTDQSCILYRIVWWLN